MEDRNAWNGSGARENKAFKPQAAKIGNLEGKGLAGRAGRGGANLHEP
jgi:hypothetical protein